MHTSDIYICIYQCSVANVKMCLCGEIYWGGAAQRIKHDARTSHQVGVAVHVGRVFSMGYTVSDGDG